MVYLEIGDGMARVASSPCPGQICVKTGIIRHAPEEVACVPAQVLLILEGPAGPNPKSKGADAITF